MPTRGRLQCYLMVALSPRAFVRKGLDRTLLLMINAHHESIGFILPSVPGGERWRLLIDTNQPLWSFRQQSEAGATVDCFERSLSLWELLPPRSIKTEQDEALLNFVIGAPGAELSHHRLCPVSRHSRHEQNEEKRGGSTDTGNAVRD